MYTSASNLRRSIRRDAQAYAVTYVVPDVRLSKYLTARQFYTESKCCDWSATTPPSVCTSVLCAFISTVI